MSNVNNKAQMYCISERTQLSSVQVFSDHSFVQNINGSITVQLCTLQYMKPNWCNCRSSLKQESAMQVLCSCRSSRPDPTSRFTALLCADFLPQIGVTVPWALSLALSVALRLPTHSASTYSQTAARRYVHPKTPQNNNLLKCCWCVSNVRTLYHIEWN